MVVKRKPISPSPQNGDSVTIPSDVGVDIGAIGAVLCAETPASDSPCLSTAEIDPTTTSCDNSSSVSAAAAAAATFVVEQDTSLDGWHSDGSFRVAMDPRPNEIDEFGVVNNTCYNVFMCVFIFLFFKASKRSLAAKKRGARARKKEKAREREGVTKRMLRRWRVFFSLSLSCVFLSSHQNEKKKKKRPPGTSLATASFPSWECRPDAVKLEASTGSR